MISYSSRHQRENWALHVRCARTPVFNAILYDDQLASPATDLRPLQAWNAYPVVRPRAPSTERLGAPKRGSRREGAKQWADGAGIYEGFEENGPVGRHFGCRIAGGGLGRGGGCGRGGVNRLIGRRADRDGGASFAIKTLSIRGLAGDQTLVLVNGKRRHNTSILFVNGTTQNGQSPPDLDLIPSAGIERIEVLRDGASAQYGSDALAGVVNIILKSGEGGSGQVLLGATGKEDGQTAQGSLNYGIKLNDKGFLNVTLDAQTTTLVDRGGFSPNTSVLYPLINGQLDPREHTADRHTAHPGAPASQLYVGSYNGEYELTDSVKAYSFGTLSSRYSAAWLTYRIPTAANNIISVYPNGYSPRLFLQDRDYQFAVGLKGEVAGFNWDLSTTPSRNENIFDTNSLNASLGPASPTHFYAGTLVFKEWTTNLDVNREFDLGLYKPTFVAAGAEYRADEFQIIAGQPESYIIGNYVAPPGQPNAGVVTQGGSQGVSGFSPFAAGTFKRQNESLYLDIEQKLTSSFEVSVAGRYEHYSDFGSTETYKVSGRWEPIENYALRGTISSGFRAPSLQQEHYGSSSTIGVVVPPSTVTQLYPVQLLSRTGSCRPRCSARARPSAVFWPAWG